MQAMASVRPPRHQVAGCGFGCGDRRGRFAPTEHGLDRQCFSLVAERRRGTVRIDVPDVGGLHPGALQRTLHAGRSTRTIRAGRRDMVCIRGIGPACQHGVNRCAAREGVLFGFNQQRAAAFPDDKTVPVEVKRAAGMERIVVAARKRLGLRQAGHHDRAEDALPANGKTRPPRPR